MDTSPILNTNMDIYKDIKPNVQMIINNLSKMESQPNYEKIRKLVEENMSAYNEYGIAVLSATGIVSTGMNPYTAAALGGVVGGTAGAIIAYSEAKEQERKHDESLVGYRQSKSKIDSAKEKLFCKYFELANEIISNEYESTLVLNAITMERERNALEKEYNDIKSYLNQTRNEEKFVSIILVIMNIIFIGFFGFVYYATLGKINYFMIFFDIIASIYFIIDKRKVKTARENKKRRLIELEQLLKRKD